MNRSRLPENYFSSPIRSEVRVHDPTKLTFPRLNRDAMNSGNKSRTMVIEDHSKYSELPLLNDYILHRVGEQFPHRIVKDPIIEAMMRPMQ